MPDFGDARYESYGAVCRELKLKREYQLGDWVLVWDSDAEQQAAPSLVQDSDDGRHWTRMAKEGEFEIVWLPTLADWLEMLGEPLVPWLVDPEVLRPVKVMQFVANWMTHHVGYSYEEACARIWMAVTRPT